MISSKFKWSSRKQFWATLKPKYQWISNCRSKATKLWSRWIWKTTPLKSNWTSTKSKTHMRMEERQALEIEGGCLDRKSENLESEEHHLIIRARCQCCQRIWWVIIRWPMRKQTLYTRETNTESQQISSSQMKLKGASRSCSIRSKSKHPRCSFRRTSLQLTLPSATQ